MARGMDFAAVGTVVNFDFPLTSTAYIHRIGRSGRAGRVGNAVTFFTEEDAKKADAFHARVMQRRLRRPRRLLNLEADKNEKKYKPLRRTDARTTKNRVDNKEGYVSRDIRAGKKSWNTRNRGSDVQRDEKAMPQPPSRRTRRLTKTTRKTTTSREITTTTTLPEQEKEQTLV